jgi:transcription factor 1
MPRTETHDRVAGKRVEIVSEQLCGNRTLTRTKSWCTFANILADDIIGHLAPSLEVYKGCTLIDVHPGACLWSSKLHDFLKPKRHILMEPERRYYETFVKPLLDQPDSTYRHSPLVGAHPREYWDSYSKIFDDKDLVGRKALPPNDPKLREIDTSILLTGNLWRKYPVQHKAKYADHTTLLLQHMTYAALTNDIFHRTGLVRMLWWAPDAVKGSTFPSAVRSKKSFDLALQMGANVTEVAGVSRVEDAKSSARAETRRAPEIDAAVTGRVERRMAEQGLEIPSHRRMPTSLDAIKVEDDISVTDGVLATTCTSIDELNTAIEAFHTITEQVHVEFPNIKIDFKFKTRDRGMTPERTADIYKRFVRYKQSIDLVAGHPNKVEFASSVVAQVRAVLALDIELRLLNLEAEYAAVRDTNPDPAALAACRAKILASSKAVTELIIGHVGERKRFGLHGLIDDLVSAEAQPAILGRDRRPYEPLQAHPHEFWPQYELTLLDIVPKTAELSAPGIADRREGTKVCQELLKQLFHSPKISVDVALDRMAPNASQDLIPEVPAMTDARRGGRLDVGRMSVRMLTPEMVDGLVRAFLEWPFRPSSVEMALAQEPGEGGEELDGEVA